MFTHSGVILLTLDMYIACTNPLPCLFPGLSYQCTGVELWNEIYDISIRTHAKPRYPFRCEESSHRSAQRNEAGTDCPSELCDTIPKYDTSQHSSTLITSSRRTGRRTGEEETHSREVCVLSLSQEAEQVTRRECFTESRYRTIRRG